MKLFKTITCVIILIGFFACSSSNHKFFDIKPEDVSSITLHWKSHHYTNENSDHYNLEKTKVDAFIIDFNDLRPTLKTDFNSCYEVIINYIDNTKEVYKCDGEFLINPHNNNVYRILLEENIITKYWGIRKRDFCLKQDKAISEK